MQNSKLTTYQRLVDIPNILAVILKITALGNIVLAIIWSRDGVGLGAKALLSLAGMSLLLLWVNHRGRHKLVGVIFFITILIITTWLLIHEDGFYNAPILVYPLLVVFSGLVFGRKSIFFSTASVTLLTLLLFILQRQGTITPFDGAIIFWTGDLFIALAFMITTGAVLSILMNMIEKNLQEIVDSEESLRDVYNQTLIGWAKALELRGREPQGHYQRMMDLVIEFSDSLDLDEDMREELRRGALLHDIGKMGISDAVLLKPGPLTDEEFRIIQQHPHLAERMLEKDLYLKEIVNIALYHHEAWDGAGYPEGLKGEQIPYSARIFTLVDNWDALTTPQVYRTAWPREKAIDYIRQQAGKKFDKELALLFIRLMESGD